MRPLYCIQRRKSFRRCFLTRSPSLLAALLLSAPQRIYYAHMMDHFFSLFGRTYSSHPRSFDFHSRMSSLPPRALPSYFFFLLPLQCNSPLLDDPNAMKAAAFSVAILKLKLLSSDVSCMARESWFLPSFLPSVVRLPSAARYFLVD